MDIEVSHREARVPVTIFGIRGDLGAESSEALLERARTAYEAGTRHLLLDLSKVDFVSSAGLRAFHEIYVLLRSDSPAVSNDAVLEGIRSGTYHSSHLKLLKATRDVKEALRLAGLDMYLEIHSNLKKAVASF